VTGIIIVAWLWCFYALYALVMGVYRAHLAQRLSPFAYALLAPFVALGFVVDVLTNITIATLLFGEPPRELLLTTRLQRYITGTGWRRNVAAWVCDTLLDPLDPRGEHC
jgi:hypothetical protein